MPKLLKEFLESLSIEDADELWDWLDGEPLAFDDMITVLAVKNPTLNN